jgi:lipid-A-disaccharide synthase-like uncharacterized protein
VSLYFWETVGITGSLIFFGRFYVQWFVSERQKRSVMPVVFWYMSCVGTLLLLPYAVFFLASPVGALSYSFNMVVYARNLVYIWREKGALSRARYIGMHALMVVVALLAVGLVGHTWLYELHLTRAHKPEDAFQNWFFIFLGTAGQGLFACRFLVQWIATEAKRKSVIPVAFWHFSIAASLMQMVSYGYRHEWVFAAGLAATVPVYARNLWLIYFHKDAAVAAD